MKMYFCMVFVAIWGKESLENSQMQSAKGKQRLAYKESFFWQNNFLFYREKQANWIIKKHTYGTKHNDCSLVWYIPMYVHKSFPLHLLPPSLPSFSLSPPPPKKNKHSLSINRTDRRLRLQSNCNFTKEDIKYQWAVFHTPTTRCCLWGQQRWCKSTEGRRVVLAAGLTLLQRNHQNENPTLGVQMLKQCLLVDETTN